MRITKRHKLYAKKNNCGTVRNLARMSPALYLHIINYMVKEGNDIYAEHNKDVKHWSDFSPIDIVIPNELNVLVDELRLRGFSNEISYNGTWKPLVVLVESK